MSDTEALHRIAAALEAIAEALETREAPDAPAPPISVADTLQVRADYNRDNAHELYGNRIYQTPNEGWRERGTGKPVHFTPYGWQVI